MKNWETEEFRQLLDLFVGDAYGENPIERLDYIRKDKRKSAEEICRVLEINGASVVLEVGSGFGFQSGAVAEKAAFLHCFDISASFLEQAKKECDGLTNISFTQIKRQPAQFPLEDNSVDSAFASAVFIHLNLFDIYWYFSEFGRLLKKGGNVLFDILDTDGIEMHKFVQFANFYREDIGCIRNLLCWNSIPAIEKVANHWSFDLVRANRYKSNAVDLLFVKK